MRTKPSEAILLLTVFVLSSIAIIPIRPVKAPSSSTLTLSDTELMLPEFQWLFDPGSSLAGKTDLAEPGVQFDLADLGKAGVGDNFPVNQLAGGALNGGYYSDFRGHSQYSILFANLGSGTIQVSLYMNTGFTGSDPRRDTFWCSNWATLGPGQSDIVTLDFSSSYEAWSIADDPEFPGHTNGEHGTPIWRLNEATSIGFQVLGSGSASVLVSGMLTPPDLEFAVVAPHSPPFQYGDTYAVEVWVTDIYDSSPLVAYDLNVTYDPNLVLFKGVDYWGVLGNGTVNLAPPLIEVKGQGGPWSGNEGLLFALTFHTEFAPSADHIWTINHASETFQIAIVGAKLSLTDGEIPMSGIVMPLPLSIEVDFIPGDVNCDGKVNIDDIGTVAYFCDKKQGDPEWPQAFWYDLNVDNVIDVNDILTIAANYGYCVSSASWLMLNMTDLGLTSPSSAYRWMDVANQAYSSSYRNSYNYSQATVTVNYYDVGETLSGKLVARNLKPNFAYQFKLVGTPGTPDNERIGLAGRWWQEEWNGSSWSNGQNLNSKGNGTSPNPNDATYFARRFTVDPSSPTGYHYRYTGYLMFDYFITDSNGYATIDFQIGSCYHVLWKTSQQSRTSNDGPLKTVTFDPDPSQPAYDYDYPTSMISIFGEWERLPMGNVNLPAGQYHCKMVFTEESFHGTGPLEGTWATAMSGDITFTIL